MNRIITLACIVIFGILNAESFTMVYEDANFKELRGVFAFSNNTVWAVGVDGTVRKSTNDGSTWSPVVISGASDYHLNAVFFSNANNGCIVGEKKAAPNRFKGIVYRTTNAGSNWSVVTSITTADDLPFRDVAFDIRDGGYPYKGRIAAGQGYVYSTTDYGQTWSRTQPVSKNVCFQSIAYSLAPGPESWVAVGDAGTGTGVVVSSDGGVEYPYPELGLNFFGVGSYGNLGIAASKGYCLKKSSGSWSNVHCLPDPNVQYGLGSLSCFVTKYMYGGSDEAFGLMNGSVINHNYGKAILDVSPAKTSGYGPALISYFAFAVSKNGRIYKYVPDDDPWPATMYVYGESQRVRCVITDSEDPSYAYIYRSTCPDGPYQLVAEFDIPVGTTIWYDYTVDFNVAYYYRIGNLPASNNPAYPTGLPNPANPPQPPATFSAEDNPNDDGGRVYATWYWQSEIAYALYRDGAPIYVGVGSQYYDNAAVTGSDHTYTVRTRKYYSPQDDYIYSSAVTANCTPVNNQNPSAPSGLAGERHFDTGIINMRWTAPANVDIHGYNIYRKIGTGPYAKVNNIPSPRGYWWDEPNTGDILYYKVTAVDWSGLESGYSNVISFGSGVPDGGGTTASGSVRAEDIKLAASPNPARGLPAIRFTLHEPAPVRFAFYDAAGKLVHAVNLGIMNPGGHSYSPNKEIAASLPNGVYFIELYAGDVKSQERCVIWR